MKTDLDNIVIGEQATVLDAIQAIDRGAVNLALVVGPERRLVATVTDGDTRRGILRGVGLEAPVSEVMRRNPLAVEEKDSRTAALKLMREHKISQVPVVDAQGRVIGLELIGEMIEPSSNDRWVVLMAGGRGDRLRPLTDTIPKPMLPIGGRPLLESIIRNLASQGFRKFFISVNYKREIIQNYFRDGRDFEVQIEYLVENEKLGTAGSLALLPSRPTKPFIVMNADLMTLVHFSSLLDFHEDHGADATVCVREYVTQSPFGVVKFDGVRLIGIEEKPKYSHMINAGIYVLGPEALDLIKPGEPCDMPTVCQAMIAKGSKVCVFPIRESWVDIGNKDDMEKARKEYADLFHDSV
jgi:dTDP-glucose pyrophosphorylase